MTTVTQPERHADSEEALRTAMEAQQSTVWTALPGIIESVHLNENGDDKRKWVVDVQPSINGQKTDQNGNISAVQMPLLLDCPVMFPQGGGCCITFPITKGDECLVIFASRCIDSWWQSGGVQGQAEFRMHDLSDGFVIVGPRSQPNAFAVSLDKLQIRSNDGEAFIQINPATHDVAVQTSGKIDFNATGNVTITAAKLIVNAPIETTGTVLNNGVNIGSTHVHSDPQGGNTGVPH